ncbi:MAG: hypothetical protein ACW98D_19580, partial [Promethearchaeota archaeon]
MENLKLAKLAFRLGLGSLLIAGIIGVIIRFHYLNPIPGFLHKNWLHAHSHITFLGWVFLGIIALLIYYFKNDPDLPHKKFRIIIWLIIITNIGMLISFPIQGYGAISIFFSAFHMVLGIYVFLLFNRIFWKYSSFGVKLINWALIFMIISGLGPIALGPIISLGYRDTYWYDLAVYFYLHFQYNGWFTLAIFGIIFLSLETSGIHKFWLYAINISIVLTYLLSTLNIRPPIWIYYLGGFGALMQILPFIYLLILILKNHKKILTATAIYSNALLLIALMAFETKLYLQFFSSIPSIADWAMHSKSIIIAYLHFILLGFVTSFLIGWWNKVIRDVDHKTFKLATSLYLLGLAGIEFTLLFYVIGVFGSYVIPFRM